VTAVPGGRGSPLPARRPRAGPGRGPGRWRGELFAAPGAVAGGRGRPGTGGQDRGGDGPVLAGRLRRSPGAGQSKRRHMVPVGLRWRAAARNGAGRSGAASALAGAGPVSPPVCPRAAPWAGLRASGGLRRRVRRVGRGPAGGTRPSLAAGWRPAPGVLDLGPPKHVRLPRPRAGATGEISYPVRAGRCRPGGWRLVAASGRGENQALAFLLTGRPRSQRRRRDGQPGAGTSTAATWLIPRPLCPTPPPRRCTARSRSGAGRNGRIGQTRGR